MDDARAVAVDENSRERLAAQGLTYRVVDDASDADAAAFVRADARGFLDADPSEDAIADYRAMLALRRSIGVFEADAAPGALPIATVQDWVTPVTVPGGELSMWAISAVTVAATHRRRGIARAMLEGELRAAASAGVPIAGLTVSEATIYERYGFASALPVAQVAVDTRRAGFIAAPTTGRLEYVEREELVDLLAAVHDTARTQRAGEIPGWPGRWRRFAGLSAEDTNGRAVRGIRHVDAEGAVTGVMVYTLREIEGEFRSEMRIRHLGTTTPEALRALWGFALQHDLVTRVTADLRPVDDPLPWLVADQRGVEMRVHDHGWLRILDVAACLTGRTYRAPLDVVLGVSDPLGFAAGVFRFGIDAEGRGTVVETDATPDAALDVAALSAVFLGGQSWARLRAAGRITASDEVVARLDDAFRPEQAPLLSIWY